MRSEIEKLYSRMPGLTCYAIAKALGIAEIEALIDAIELDWNDLQQAKKGLID